MPEIRVVEDEEELSLKAAKEILTAIHETLAKKEDFTFVLAGGNTPKKLYEKLASPEFIKEIPWDRIKFFWGDERFVAQDHVDSNYRLANEALLSKIPIPKENIHPMVTNTKDLEESAIEYENNLKYIFHVLPRFDLVLLGMGDDGHVASLFPKTPSLSEEEHWVLPIKGAPKPPSKRLTMTFPLINNAFRVILLVSGAKKAEIASKVLKEPLGRYPAQYIWPSWGTVVWWVDRAAYKG